MAFHDVRFPVVVSRGATSFPTFSTRVVNLATGGEQRLATWGQPRRRYDAGVGLETTHNFYEVLEFFHARRGRLHSFRWKDWTDYRSGDPTSEITPFDQVIGEGDGSETDFQLRKTYKSGPSEHVRPIIRPVPGTVIIALDNVPTTSFTVLHDEGIVQFDTAPAAGVRITAGFEFDVHARFNSDSIGVTMPAFRAGAIPEIPVIEDPDGLFGRQGEESGLPILPPIIVEPICDIESELLLFAPIITQPVSECEDSGEIDGPLFAPIITEPESECETVPVDGPLFAPIITDPESECESDASGPFRSPIITNPESECESEGSGPLTAPVINSPVSEC